MSPAAIPLRLLFGGDLMLGRLAGEAMLREGAQHPLGAVAPQLREADLAVANLECAICEPGERWHGAPKAFYFRAPPLAGEALREAGVRLVSLANNHILDYDVQGLLETVRILDANGILHTGAGADLAAASAPVIVERKGVRIGMAAFCDHQDDFAATQDHPGMAWLGLHDEAAAVDAFARALAPLRAEGVRWPILSLHWGPNMASAPDQRQRRLARAAIEVGWKIVFGHSAHVFQGVELYEGCPILYAAGDLVDDYAVDPGFRNDHQLLFTLEFGDDALERIVMHPLFIRHCRAFPANSAQRTWIAERMRELCAALGTTVQVEDDRLAIYLSTTRETTGKWSEG
ncbi:CapA family protein [Massilia sp. 2TAF26]|uniref:CapA family protein n=1 Tax=Massilia sp. 2TAF26 TaxID=3233012 RepID=UPI003F9E55EA